MEGARNREAEPQYDDVDGGRGNGAEEITERRAKTGSQLEEGTIEVETPERGGAMIGERQWSWWWGSDDFEDGGCSEVQGFSEGRGARFNILGEKVNK